MDAREQFSRKEQLKVNLIHFLIDTTHDLVIYTTASAAMDLYNIIWRYTFSPSLRVHLVIWWNLYSCHMPSVWKSSSYNNSQLLDISKSTLHVTVCSQREVSLIIFTGARLHAHPLPSQTAWPGDWDWTQCPSTQTQLMDPSRPSWNCTVSAEHVYTEIQFWSPLPDPLGCNVQIVGLGAQIMTASIPWL